MARYQAGDLVAFINKFERCGCIVSIDEKGKGYKIDTGYDVIYAYENEIVLLSSNAPIRSNTVITKVDHVGTQVPNYTPAFRDGLLNFLAGNSDSAKLFASYVGKVSDQALTACLRAISNIKIDKVEITIIKIEISGAIVEKLLPRNSR